MQNQAEKIYAENMHPDLLNVDFPRWKIYAHLYIRNIAANLIGFAIILILNLLTPMTSAWLGKSLLANGAGQYLLFLFPFILVIVAVLQYYFQCPVCAFVSAKARGEKFEKYSREQIRKRVLNLPVVLALTNLSVYVIVPVALILYSGFFNLFPMDLKVVGLLFFRALMIGLITACVSFFIVESYTRRVSIPMVFPEGGLTEVAGAFRINVMRRIRLLSIAGTLTPMLILVVTLSFILHDVAGTPAFSRQLVIDIFIFTVVLCAIFIIIGLRLSVLVGRSVVEPINEMLGIVDSVKRGDFSQRIKVVSNDELGVLAEAGNRMIEGLAERERVRESFGRYLTPEIRDKILSGEIPLDGEKKIATMLFSDLRDFTAYVEANEPEEVILSMRDYFTEMEESIRGHDGLVLQFIGDELEAVFGVPLDVENHADKAVHAALRMRRALEGLNRKRELAGKSPFQHGIGICTGPVLAGNNGSRNHPSYALIGETVNRASRIQELTKLSGCDILISRETRDLLRDDFPLERNGIHRIKGYNKPVEVFKVL